MSRGVRWYVRWKEKRNLEEVIGLTAAGRLDQASLIGSAFTVDRAPEALDAIGKGPGEVSARVLFAASTFPRWREDRLPDFVWRQIVHITRAFPKIRACVLAPHDRGARAREVWGGVEIRRFRYFLPPSLERLAYPAIWPNLDRSPWLILQVPFLLACEFFAALRWLRQERFAVVYSHWFMPQGVACGLAAWLTGTPHVFTSHSSDVLVMRRLPFLGPWLVRFITRRARAITTVSQRSRSHLESFFDREEWGRIEEKVLVLPMGVALAESEAALGGAVDDRSADAAPTILFVGRLAEKKGVEYLLDALALEPLVSMGASLIVAGEGPIQNALQAKAVSLGLGKRVSFAGYVSGAEKAALFRAADVVAIPSIVTAAGDAEGIPVVLLEALAAGKLTVATDASGAAEVLHPGEDGFLVPQKDAAALAAAVAHALRLPADERRAIAQRARSTARGYDWDTVARAHVWHLLALP